MDLSWILDEKLLAFDCETSGLSDTDRPFGVAIANADRSEFYDARVYPSLWDNLKPIFADPTRTWIAQNAKFDMRMVNYMGVYPSGTVTDITSMARLVYNSHMLYNLDSQARRELGIAKDRGVLDYIKKHNLYTTRKNFFGEEEKQPQFDMVPPDIMKPYAEKDARLTYDLYKHYLLKLDEQELALLEQESKLNHVCFKMERRGLLLDCIKTMSALSYESELKNSFVAAFKELTTQSYVNSAKSIQRVLSCQLPTTEKGNPSLTDDVIEDLLPSASDGDAVVLRTVRSIRTFDKRVSTYYKPYLNLKTRDNIIHPTMWIAGTKTGRFSYSDPNFQNMPKEEHSTEPHVIRGCIVPRKDRVFVSLDYKQMEYALIAAYANQTDIIEKVMAGADFHQATADLVGIERSPAKTLNFAIAFGAGIDRIASMLGCTKDAAARLKFKYFSSMPRVERFLDRVSATGVGRGYVTNWLGRKLYADKEHCYALPNHLIQGGGADVVKRAMVQIDMEFPTLPMVLQVHDQLVFEMLPEELQHVPRIKEIMETVFPPLNGMSLAVDVKWSKESLAERDMQNYAGGMS